MNLFIRFYFGLCLIKADLNIRENFCFVYSFICICMYVCSVLCVCMCARMCSCTHGCAHGNTYLVEPTGTDIFP